MKIHRSPNYIHIDLTGAEAAVLLEELENAPGGSKMPKLRQVCEGLRSSLALDEIMAPSKYAAKKYQRKVFLRAVENPPRADHVQGEEHVGDDRERDSISGVRDAAGDPRESETGSLEDGQSG